MFRYAAPTVLLALLTALLFAQTPDEGKKVALLVGVAKYDGTGLTNLKYAEKDMADLGDALTALGYQVTLVTRDEFKRTDKDFFDPTAENLRDHLKAVTRGRGARDTVLVAFSGHGVHLKATNKLYFCPAKTNLERPDTLLPIDDVMAALGECGAGAKVLLMDACRNDPTDGKGGDAKLSSLTRPLVPDPPGGTVTLFSCSKGQISHESEEFKHGFLTHFVIDGLKGKAAGKNGVISWDKLVAHVKDEVPDAVAKQKGPKVEQRPESFGKANILALGRVGAVSAIARKGGEEVEFEVADGVKMTFCWIPPGECQLGSPKAERDAVMKQLVETRFAKEGEEPDWLKSEAEGVRGKHVEKKGFWLGKYPVTQADWTAVMGTAPFWFHKNDLGANYVKGLDTSRFPAERVSWADAQGFLTAVNKRDGAKAFGVAGQFALPHEDRWEYACRGGLGNKTAFYWGDTLNGDKANCDATTRSARPRKGRIWGGRVWWGVTRS